MIHLALGFSTALAVALLARETLRLEDQAPRIGAVLAGIQQDSPATPALVVQTNLTAAGADQPAVAAPTSS